MFAVLIPRALDPTVAGAAMPLPTPRPVVVATRATKPAKATTQNPAMNMRPATRVQSRWRRL
jgi:hypothetical protein